MKPYEPQLSNADSPIQLGSNNDWLRRRQSLALPVLPPTTMEARQYFFTESRNLSLHLAQEGKTRIDYERFAIQWNSTADGKTRFYVTPEILATYAKSWEKVNNVKASKEIISEEIRNTQKTAAAFAAPDLPFPSFLTDTARSSDPQRGVLEIDPESHSQTVPASISTTATAYGAQKDYPPRRTEPPSITALTYEDMQYSFSTYVPNLLI